MTDIKQNATENEVETEMENVTEKMAEQETTEKEITEKETAGDVQEYITFTVTAKDGTEVEMAVVDEFEFEKKHYVVGAVIENDTVKEDGCYIYRSVFKGDEFSVEKITNPADYRKISEAYMNL